MKLSHKQHWTHYMCQRHFRHKFYLFSCEQIEKSTSILRDIFLSVLHKIGEIEAIKAADAQCQASVADRNNRKLKLTNKS